MNKEIDANTGPSLSMLSREQCAQIHSAALVILETVGIAIHEPQALKLLHGAGAHVANGRVTIPPSVVEDALGSAPSGISVFDRDGQTAMRLEGHQSYFGGHSSLVDYQDPISGERRELISSDVGLLTRVIDALPNLHFTTGGACAADYEPSVQHRVVFKQVVTNTTKPIVFVADDAADLSDILDIASIISGDLERLVEKPFVIHYTLATSPLTLSDSSVRKLLLCANKGIPSVWATMPQGGATAPVTFAGILAQANAECLSGLVINQLCRPGAPFIYGAIPSHFDMKTMIFPFGAPELHLLCAAQTDMAHYYMLPVFGTAGCTDAKEIDAQAGAEIALSIFWAALSGANLVHDVGLLDHATILNPDVFVFADEVIDLVRQYSRPMNLDAEDLALDVIREVGRGGTFLDHPHTMAHYKEHWYPRLFDRTTWEIWLQRGAENLSARVRRRTDEILKTHFPKPLSKNAHEEIEKLERKWLS